MNLLIRWFATAATLLIIAYAIPGITVTGVYIALITALVLGLVNAVIRPIFIVLTLPINIVTLGLFTFVINALMFWFVASFIDGFAVSGFWVAFFGAFLLTVSSWIVNQMLHTDKR
jgi:putative membrane protein